MATQTQSNGSQVYDFTPVEYDAGTLPPRIAAGRYECVAAASIQGTKKDNFPMLVVKWTVQSVADGNEENETAVGTTVTDYIVLNEGQKFRSGKQRLRGLFERLGLSYDLVPRQIANKTDVEELLNAITGQTLSLNVTVRTDDNGEARENVDYRLPREDTDEGMETQQERPAARAAAAKKPAAKKSASRR